MSSGALGKREKWVYCEHLYYVFQFLCKVDYENNKFIHAPTYAYNKVMRLFELASVVEHKYDGSIMCIHLLEHVST